MARVNPELKKTLEADGRWREFMLLRREKIAGGLKGAEALNAAIAEVCPELARYGSLCKTGRKRVGSGVEAAGKVADAANVSEELERKKREKAEGRLIDPKVFEGKPEASASEEVLWAAKNLYEKVSVEDAPGQIGWNVLLACREIPDLKAKFMLSFVGDVLKRKSEDDSNREKWSGERIYKTLDEYLESCGEAG
jgi:hypothetical protein